MVEVLRINNLEEANYHLAINDIVIQQQVIKVMFESINSV
jgi:hypothetical protein